MLTPENLDLPGYGIANLKSLLIQSVGVLYEDQVIKLDYKSKFDNGTGKAAILFMTKSGTIKSLSFEEVNTGGLTIRKSEIKRDKNTSNLQISLVYSNQEVMTSLPKFNLMFTANN